MREKNFAWERYWTMLFRYGAKYFIALQCEWRMLWRVARPGQENTGATDKIRTAFSAWEIRWECVSQE